MVCEMRGRSNRIKRSRREFRGKIKIKKLGVIQKVMQYIPETIPDFPTIVNIPLHPDTGRLLINKKDVQERKTLHKGTHTYWLALLMGDRGNIIQREVFA